MADDDIMRKHFIYTQNGKVSCMWSEQAVSLLLTTLASSKIYFPQFILFSLLLFYFPIIRAPLFMSLMFTNRAFCCDLFSIFFITIWQMNYKQKLFHYIQSCAYTQSISCTKSTVMWLCILEQCSSLCEREKNSQSIQSAKSYCKHMMSSSNMLEILIHTSLWFGLLRTKKLFRFMCFFFRCESFPH